jgi:hypothetical protein
MIRQMQAMLLAQQDENGKMRVCIPKTIYKSELIHIVQNPPEVTSVPRLIKIELSAGSYMVLDK